MRHLFMKGTALLIAVFPVSGILMVLHVDRYYSTIVTIALAVIGFAMQLYALFSEKNSFERDMRRKREEQERTMEKAMTLPPEQAIDMLLKKM
ncbi:MAG: hypothetical protein HGA31_02150 [Candidatus Moranbacteria bacterium]|nr:hypothetical protein [Candidatus Moranbacteria bacterium]